MANGLRGDGPRVSLDRADVIRSAVIARLAIRGATHASIGRITGLSKSGVGVRVAKMSPAELRQLAAADLVELAAVDLAAEPAPAG